MQPIKTFFLKYKKVILPLVIVLFLLLLCGVYLITRNFPNVGQLSENEVPIVQIEAYGKLYDGGRNSGCWRGLCWDNDQKSVISEVKPIYIEAGKSLAVKIKAYGTPKSLTATIIRQDGTQQKVIP